MSDYIFKTWMLLTYDLENGFRSCLAIANSPFKPQDSTPIYSTRKTNRQKWVRFDSVNCGGDVEVSFGLQKIVVTNRHQQKA